MGGKIDPISPVNPSAEIQKDKNQEDKIKTLVEISEFERILRQEQARQEQSAQSEKAEEKEEKTEVSQETYQQVSLQQSYYLMDRLINQSKKKDEEEK